MLSGKNTARPQAARYATTVWASAPAPNEWTPPPGNMTRAGVPAASYSMRADRPPLDVSRTGRPALLSVAELRDERPTWEFR